MCVIIVLPVNTMLPLEALKNAVYNNPHSMGLILKDANGKTSMIKEAEEETKWERVQELLEQNRDCKRYLHLRWATKGGKNLENAQFFEVYSSNKRTIYFGHNGTLGVGFGGMGEKDNSDTKDFADKVISKSLLRWTGEHGKADYTDPMYHELLVKPQWTMTSKGILVSNDLDDLMFGPERDGWTNFTVNGEKTPIMVSNVDYFTEVKRGPEKERRDAAKRAEEAAKRQSEAPFRFGPHQTNNGTNGNGGSNTAVALNFARDMLGRDVKVLESLQRMFANHDITTRDGLRSVAYCTREEITEFVKKNPSSNLIELVVLLSDAVDDLMKDLEMAAKKVGRMQKRINKLQNTEPTDADEDEDQMYDIPANVHTVG